MLTFHSVKIDGEIHRTNPLFVGNFFNLKRMWWRKRKQRQNLILSIASTWYAASKKNTVAPGFIEEEILITSLTNKVKDAKQVLEHFFNINRIGFNFNNGIKSPTIVSPKKLKPELVDAIAEILDDITFDPGPRPTKKRLVQSTVKVRTSAANFIRAEVRSTGKTHLMPAVNWLLEQKEPITFFYEAAGKLQARDKSVWPIKSIETWPGWLRQELFGTVVDLENAYCQYLVGALEKKYSNRPLVVELKYPSLIQAVKCKKEFREYICKDLLKLDITDDSLKAVKKLIMSLANGSNISSLMLVNSSGRSQAVNIINEINPHLSYQEKITAGKYLGFIAKQFKAAKKDLCVHLYGLKPSRENEKMIFKSYMEWE